MIWTHFLLQLSKEIIQVCVEKQLRLEAELLQRQVMKLENLE